MYVLHVAQGLKVSWKHGEVVDSNFCLLKDKLPKLFLQWQILRKLSDSNTNLVENHRGASMSEATDQLGSSPPMELRQMGVTKGRKMYLNIGEGR